MKKHNENQKTHGSNGSKVLNLGISLGLMLILGACGKTAYQAGKSEKTTEAPGHFVVPAKVDILLAEDDTGSIIEAYEPIAKQMPQFLHGLEEQGWDYHFATTPLTTQRPIRQVVASQFDANWQSASGKKWKPPYPGAKPSDPKLKVSPQAFTKPEEYGGFISKGAASNAGHMHEPGFKTIRYALNQGVKGTGFLREKAMLVIFVVTNGEDTSDVQTCERNDGLNVPCEQTTQNEEGSLQSSFAKYKQAFLDVKNNKKKLLRFYAASAEKATEDCLGTRSHKGTRYQKMAKELGGKNYDICSTQIARILSDLKGQLKSERLKHRQKYIVLEQEPNLEKSIEVTVQINGDPNNTQTIPRDPNNGWSYIGYRQNKPIIVWPSKLHPATGYFIQLNGEAQKLLTGKNTASVRYTPVGVEDAAK